MPLSSKGAPCGAVCFLGGGGGETATASTAGAAGAGEYRAWRCHLCELARLLGFAHATSSCRPTVGGRLLPRRRETCSRARCVEGALGGWTLVKGLERCRRAQGVILSNNDDGTIDACGTSWAVNTL